MDEVLKIPSKAQMAEQNVLLEKIHHDLERLVEEGVSPTDHAQYDAIFQAMLDGTNTTAIFEAWYPRAVAAMSSEENRFDLLERWFTMLAHAGQHTTYTLSYYVDEVSGDSTMTPMDDLANLPGPAQLCTEETEAVTDWADESPLLWYVRANALSKADGTMNVLAVEDQDAIFDVSGELAPVYTFQVALWTREWDDGTHNYKSWKTIHAANYYPYAESVDPEGKKRVMTWHPSFGGGLNSLNGLTSGAGLAPYNFASANTGLSAARRTSAHEGLWSDCDTQFALDMWQLRHWNLENSGILEGCTNYNLQHVVALGEEQTKRILLTPAQAGNFIVGSSVQLGTHPEGTNSDRSTAANHDVFNAKRIAAIETVTIDGTEYGALEIESEEPFDVPATALVSTAPWFSGNTELLPGHKDGCTISLTSGKTPIRVAGIELLDGAYAIGLDPLYNVTANEEGGFDYALYECRNSENLAGSITANYVDTGIRGTGIAAGWNYIKSFTRTRLGIVWPKAFGGASSTYFKSALYGSSGAGVRAPWRFGLLSSTGGAGLACALVYNTPASTHWDGRPRLSGAGKKRGEWVA